MIAAPLVVPSSGFTPTPEQAQIVAAYRTGADLIISAGAGCGKTSTLALIADQMHLDGKTGRYITFNTAMADQVKETFRHENVTTGTMHGLAWSIIAATPYSPLLDKVGDTSPVPSWMRAGYFGISTTLHFASTAALRNRSRGLVANMSQVLPNDFVAHALTTVDHWCISDDPTIDIRHVPHVVGMPEEDHTTKFAPLVVDLAQRLWSQDIMSINGVLPFTHDHYVKLCALFRPDLSGIPGMAPGSVLFFDEAQDSRPCVTGMLLAQRAIQLIVVGDSAQAIYGFTGAIDSLPAFASRGGQRLPLSVSWRFGPDIALIANHLLHMMGEPLRLTGGGGTSSVHTYSLDGDVPNVDAVLCRTNESLLRAALAHRARGKRVHLATDTKRLKAYAFDFAAMERGDRPTSYALRDFTGIEDVTEYIARTDSADPLRPILSLLLRVGSGSILEALANSVPEDEADVVCSTIHKAKGQQWDRVQIAAEVEDLLPYSAGSTAIPREDRDRLMLAYVAVTRAKRTLHLPEALAAALLDRL